jgi:hypothetical protein
MCSSLNLFLANQNTIVLGLTKILSFSDSRHFLFKPCKSTTLLPVHEALEFLLATRPCCCFGSTPTGIASTMTSFANSFWSSDQSYAGGTLVHHV